MTLIHPFQPCKFQQYKNTRWIFHFVVNVLGLLFIYSPLRLLSSVQVWWATQTTHTASLRTSKAAVLKEFHRRGVELLFRFSLEWCLLLTQTSVLPDDPFQTKIAMPHVSYNNKADRRDSISFCLLILVVNAVCWLDVEAFFFFKFSCKVLWTTKI